MQTILHEARNGNFEMVHSMIMVEFQKVYYPLSHHCRKPVPSIIYNLAHRNKHEEVKNYLRLNCRFSELMKRLYLSKFDTEDFAITTIHPCSTTLALESFCNVYTQHIAN